MTSLDTPLTFTRGPAMKNRFMLAPLTNTQSMKDGTLSDTEIRWLVRRAEGGFGLTMTAGAMIDPHGKGFPGQLGAYDDRHLPGLTRMAKALNAAGTISVVQLLHAGIRAPKDEIEGPPVGPSADEETGARAMTPEEVQKVRTDYVAAALRAEKAGFKGVEIHGAHGYLLCQFISPELNQRTDEYGGSLENRSRLLFEIIDDVRAACGPDFSVGVRLSPERFGVRLMEIREIVQKIMRDGKVDYVDMSLWDVFKQPVEEEGQSRNLLGWFTDLDRGDVRLTAAGKLTTAAKCQQAMDEGLDFVVIGRGAILHHDFPQRAIADPAFEPVALPASKAHLLSESVGRPFIQYLGGWPGFVADGS